MPRIQVPGYTDSYEQRAALVAKHFRVTGTLRQVESVDGDIITMSETPNFRPYGKRVQHGNGVKDVKDVLREAAERGYDVIAWDPIGRTSIQAKLPPATRQLRGTIAMRLTNCQPWDLEIHPRWSADGHLQEVFVARSPSLQKEKSARMAEWAKVVSSLPDSGPGWRVRDLGTTGQVCLVYGETKTLPSRVGYDWEIIDGCGWGTVCLGIGPDGPIFADLATNPHTLVTGKTGSGKSIEIESIVTGLIVPGVNGDAGWDLAICEPQKRGLDFRWARGLVREDRWGCANYDDAVAVVEGALAEGLRRLDIMDDLDIAKWTDLPADLREREGIRPLLLVVDELSGVAKMRPVPKMAKPGSPAYDVPFGINEKKERIFMALSTILAECRFVGVHCLLGNQSFNVSDLGHGAGGMRHNLGNRLIFGRASRTVIGMALTDASEAAEAYEAAHGGEIADTDAQAASQKATAGRGIAELDGQGYIPMQGMYALHPEILAKLSERGIIPRVIVKKPRTEAPAPATAAPSPSLAKRPAAAPKSNAFS